MNYRYAVSLVLEAHAPFAKEFHQEDDLNQVGEESRFFETISETLLPLLEVFDRLDNDHIFFRVALVLSPILCSMLCDEQLQNKYLHYADKQIEFGRQEIERTRGDEALNKLAEKFYNKLLDRRILYTERYNNDILKAFDHYKRKGKIEILASSATHSFLPFLAHNTESLQAQVEAPIAEYRQYFGETPQGFWLPELGWTPAVEPFLRAYNYTYSIVDSHGLLYSKSLPKKGTFYPVKLPTGTLILARDFYAVREIEQISNDEVYMDTGKDVGYELPPEIVSPFLSEEGERHKTGYKYWNRCEGGENKNLIYNPDAAYAKITENARLFLENTVTRLEDASKCMDEAPISLFAQAADCFGRFWYEGSQFIETIFRMAEGYRDLQFVTPSEYLCKQNISNIQTVVPEFSSWGVNGYAETWLDSSCDWIYRHLMRAMERMIELAEHFPDNVGIKERALNQAAREILLAQSCDWASLLNRQESTEFAQNKVKNALRNFTTIYEALGSNYISTEWLTKLEKRHNIFPHINYRIFRRKK